MKITRRAQHAVHAVIDLALNAEKGGSRSLEIARRTGVPEKFLDVVLLNLRKAGIVASKRGPDGGHWLAGDPAKLTVGTILLAIDGASSITSPPERKGTAPSAVCMEGLWANIAEAVRSVTDKITVEDLRRQAAGQVADYTI